MNQFKTELTEKQKMHVANFRLCLADHPEYRKYHNFHKVSLKWWDWIKPMTVLPPNDNSIDEGIREILKAYWTMSKQKPKRRKPKHIGPTKKKQIAIKQPTKLVHVEKNFYRKA